MKRREAMLRKEKQKAAFVDIETDPKYKELDSQDKQAPEDNQVLKDKHVLKNNQDNQALALKLKQTATPRRSSRIKNTESKSGEMQPIKDLVKPIKKRRYNKKKDTIQLD